MSVHSFCCLVLFEDFVVVLFGEFVWGGWLVETKFHSSPADLELTVVTEEYFELLILQPLPLKC